MADVVNLRLARKRKRRAENERDAARKRLAHGRRRGDLAAERLARELELKRLEAHRRESCDAADPEG